jgi:serine protease Do
VQSVGNHGERVSATDQRAVEVERDEADGHAGRAILRHAPIRRRPRRARRPAQGRDPAGEVVAVASRCTRCYVPVEEKAMTSMPTRSVKLSVIGLALLAGALPSGGVSRADAETIRELFKKVAPSVVMIRARGRDVTEGGETRFSETGSGVLISTDGKVMTAAHVVHAMDQLSVEFLGGETVAARVVGSEPAADLSLLQLERVPPGAKVAPMGDSSKMEVGDEVIVVGAPYGLSYSLSAGLISAHWPPNTVYKAIPLAEFFQTDASINTGNSGGPMFNMAGEVVGIVSHNISKSGGSEGLGFAVTLNTAKQLLLEKRSVWSGLEGLMLSDQLADLLNLPPKTSGYIIKTVAKGSLADQMGARGSSVLVNIGGQEVPLGGDIILSIAGIPMGPANIAKVREAMSRLAPGAPFTVQILRAGQVVELTGHAP